MHRCKHTKKTDIELERRVVEEFFVRCDSFEYTYLPPPLLFHAINTIAVARQRPHRRNINLPPIMISSTHQTKIYIIYVNTKQTFFLLVWRRCHVAHATLDARSCSDCTIQKCYLAKRRVQPHRGLLHRDIDTAIPRQGIRFGHQHTRHKWIHFA